MFNSLSRHVELLAPAGEPEAGYAALHYGADAIYLGLARFSARAEAVNFTLDQLSEIIAYAHAQIPRRRVFVTVNTVILQHELAEVVELLAALADAEVDAVIVQDLGIACIIREHFPEFPLHASTQLAIHNLPGAQTAKTLGFARVTLARELTLDEIRTITAASGIETETFIHGALCYAYSGLCLFSSMLLGRSGNRGRCAYPCREFCHAPAPLADGLPFSTKDLALGEYVAALCDAGVSCLKIEGRKKSPLYVATVVNYYRRLLDGTLTADAARECAAHIRTVFSRSWTKFFIASPHDQTVVDRDVVGHRGVPIGQVAAVEHTPRGDALRLTLTRPLERHDGLQIDVRERVKPFGFAVDELRLPGKAGKGQGQPVFVAPAGATVCVALPPEHPTIPPGATVYCASSQAVKRSYPYIRPKPGADRVRRTLNITLTVTSEAVRVQAIVPTRHQAEQSLVVDMALTGVFDPATTPAKTTQAARAAFAKLGNTRLRLGAFECYNPAALFLPAALLNALRRQVVAEVERQLAQAQQVRVAAVQQAVRSTISADTNNPPAQHNGALRWSIKVDRMAYLATFALEDWENIAEVVVDIGHDALPDLETHLARLARQIGRQRIRLALPIIVREWDLPDLRTRIAVLRQSGWQRWQVTNLAAWTLLGANEARATSPSPSPDLSTDWPMYVLNRQAALWLMQMGVTQFTLSPEDTRENLRGLLAEFGPQATMIVYQDTPLFLSASCAYANLAGGCPGQARCHWETLPLRLHRGEAVTVTHAQCLTVVTSDRPFLLADRLHELQTMGAVNVRADFVWRPYTSDAVRDLWRRLRAGRDLPPGHQANFDRGLY